MSASKIQTSIFDFWFVCYLKLFLTNLLMEWKVHIIMKIWMLKMTNMNPHDRVISCPTVFYYVLMMINYLIWNYGDVGWRHFLVRFVLL